MTTLVVDPTTPRTRRRWFSGGSGPIFPLEADKSEAVWAALWFSKLPEIPRFDPSLVCPAVRLTLAACSLPPLRAPGGQPTARDLHSYLGSDNQHGSALGRVNALCGAQLMGGI